MEIHNLMEDKVLQTLHEICDEEEKKGSKNYCTSEQCRLDAACFVLNRIPQRYVTSGRGFAYLESDFSDNPQMQIDVVTLCHEGLRRVTGIRRSFYSDADLTEEVLVSESGYYFNFPVIKGRVLNGISFETVSNVDITFMLDGTLVPMLDSRWPNPYSIVGNTPGTYLFWPKPVAAKENEEKEFELELIVNSEDYEPFRHYLTVKLKAESITTPTALRPKRDLHLQDLFLIPSGIEDEMQ